MFCPHSKILMLILIQLLILIQTPLQWNQRKGRTETKSKSGSESSSPSDKRVIELNIKEKFYLLVQLLSCWMFLHLTLMTRPKYCSWTGVGHWPNDGRIHRVRCLNHHANMVTLIYRKS